MFESVGVLNIWVYMAGLFVIILTPGPNSLYVLRTATSKGIKNGYKAAMGIFTGDAILVFLSWIGVAAAIQASPVLYAAVRYLGAVYLIWLGARILYSSFWGKQQSAEGVVHITTEKVFRKSLILSLTNPKAILFYVSFFVQFIDFNYAHTWISYSVLALLLELVSFLYLSLLIIAGARLVSFLGRKRVLAKSGNGLTGLFFMAFAARLASAG